MLGAQVEARSHGTVASVPADGGGDCGSNGDECKNDQNGGEASHALFDARSRESASSPAYLTAQSDESGGEYRHGDVFNTSGGPLDAAADHRRALPAEGSRG